MRKKSAMIEWQSRLDGPSGLILHQCVMVLWPSLKILPEGLSLLQKPGLGFDSFAQCCVG